MAKTYSAGMACIIVIVGPAVFVIITFKQRVAYFHPSGGTIAAGLITQCRSAAALGMIADERAPVNRHLGILLPVVDRNGGTKGLIFSVVSRIITLEFGVSNRECTIALVPYGASEIPNVVILEDGILDRHFAASARKNASAGR